MSWIKDQCTKGNCSPQNQKLNKNIYKGKHTTNLEIKLFKTSTIETIKKKLRGIKNDLDK